MRFDLNWNPPGELTKKAAESPAIVLAFRRHQGRELSNLAKLLANLLLIV